MSTPRKVALVTGSATGVGRASAIRFAKLGYAVAVNYSRSADDAAETLRLVQAEGVPGFAHKADVGTDSEVRELLARVRTELGGLDVLVNNAATTQFIPHADLDALADEIWDEIFRVNVKGVLYCTRAALPMLQEHRGCVVNVTSVAGLSGSGSSVPYCATKGAVNTMTKSFAKAFGPAVRFNAVAPGPILTRWLAGKDEHVAKFVEGAPLQKAATADDIAEMVEFLAVRAGLMTGQILVADGGRTM